MPSYTPRQTQILWRASLRQLRVLTSILSATIGLYRAAGKTAPLLGGQGRRIVWHSHRPCSGVKPQTRPDCPPTWSTPPMDCPTWQWPTSPQIADFAPESANLSTSWPRHDWSTSPNIGRIRARIGQAWPHSPKLAETRPRTDQLRSKLGEILPRLLRCFGSPARVVMGLPARYMAAFKNDAPFAIACCRGGRRPATLLTFAVCLREPHRHGGPGSATWRGPALDCAGVSGRGASAATCVASPLEAPPAAAPSATI